MTDQRTATINRDSNGEILGVSIFLGAHDLAQLGLQDFDELEYTIKEGELQLGKPDLEVPLA